MLMIGVPRSARALILAVSLAATVWVQPQAGEQQPAGQTAPSGNSLQVTVEASQQWVDTNIDLRPSEKLRFTASGEITYPQQGKSKEHKFGPEGLARGFADLIRQYPVTDAGHGTLVGRLGPADTG